MREHEKSSEIMESRMDVLEVALKVVLKAAGHEQFEYILVAICHHLKSNSLFLIGKLAEPQVEPRSRTEEGFSFQRPERLRASNDFK